jgi:multidrug efflux pump subunit AcrA (membrane-fusion protein)
MRFDRISRGKFMGGAAVGLLFAASLAWTVASRQKWLARSDGSVPLAVVKRGDLALNICSSGELRASHSRMLTAPPIGGGTLQINRLLHAGMPVKKGAVVIEFDPSEQRFKLEQSRSELLEAEEEIIKAKADAKVQASEDNVALLKARYDVRRAELEVGKNELVSTIQAQKNQLALEQAKRALTEREQDVQSHASSAQATIGLAEEKRTKARLAMDQARDNIEKLRVVAPMDGLVSIEKNQSGEFFFEGQSRPDYHVGDEVHAGSSVAEVIDPREMELAIQVSELQRSNIQVGQLVEIEFDALPARILHGKVKSAAGMAQRQFFWETNAEGKFDVLIEMLDGDPRLRPGLTAGVVIKGETLKGTLNIPRLALFQKKGKQVIYVRHAGNFAELEVKIAGETESRAAISGVKAGDEVAMIDPTAPRKAPGGADSSRPEESP